MIYAPLIRNALAATIGAAAAQLLTKFFSYLATSNTIQPRYARKLAHILTAPLFVLTFPLYTSAPYARYFAALVPLSFAVRIARNPANDSFSAAVTRNKDDVARTTSEALGLAAYGASVGILTALGWRNDVATYVAVSALSFGDAAADLIGSAFNALPLPLPRAVFVKKKTLPGTLALVAATVLGGMGMVDLIRRLDLVQRGVSWRPLLKVGLAAATIEVLPVEDNLTVPLCAFFVAKRVFGESRH